MVTVELEPDASWDNLYINGEMRPASDGETMSVTEPATGEVFTEVPAATETDVDAAYSAAEKAQPEWEAMSREERLALVEEARDLMKDHFGDLVTLLGKESGAVNPKAVGEVSIALSDFRMAASFESQDEMRDSAFVEDKESHIVHKPVGVVGIISPWNFPLHLSTRALAPALALGNTVVLKPASATPITGGLLLAKICEAVGFPDGVVNVVTGRGSEIGDRIAGHPTPRVLSFTGSTGVGKQVAKQASENLTLPALELGGNAPYIVTDDTDLDQAVAVGAYGTFFHQGQACISINRHLVHEDVYDDYVAGMVERAESFEIGDPLDEDVTFGPLIDETQRDNVVSYIERTVEEGATLETGGGADGLYVEPTVLSDCTNEMAAACEEHFGPIAPIIPFSSDEEAIKLANETEYGLSAAVYCADLDRGRTLADQVESGMVHVNDHPIQEEPNAPFGGVKNSGLGRYNGEWIRDELTEPKWISVQTEDRDYDLP
jgi:aldehyde dehydrogenase (NAD+)